MSETNNEAVQIFRADWDEKGVWFYQAFNTDIADWALANQTFAGCPAFRPLRNDMDEAVLRMGLVSVWIRTQEKPTAYAEGQGRPRGFGCTTR